MICDISRKVALPPPATPGTLRNGYQYHNQTLYNSHNVWQSAVFLLILLGQATHLQQPSEGASTEESEEGGTGVRAPGALNPGSSSENSLITVKHRKAIKEENNEP